MTDSSPTFARVVGKDRDEIELDPVATYRRGRALDAQLRFALPPPRRGVYRGTFADFARMDEERAAEAARGVGNP